MCDLDVCDADVGDAVTVTVATPYDTLVRELSRARKGLTNLSDINGTQCNGYSPLVASR